MCKGMVVFLVILMALCLSCRTLVSSGLGDVRPILLRKDLVELDVAHGNPGTDRTLEFSADGTAVCVWWQSANQRAGERGRLAVLDLKGQIVSNAVSETGSTLALGYKALFPKTDEKTCGLFIAETNDCMWAFDSDRGAGLCVTKLPCASDEFGNVWKAEYWELSPSKKMIWKINLPRSVYAPRLLAFCGKGAERVLLVAFLGKTAYLLSQKDGSTLAEIGYGNEHLVKDVKAYRKKHGFDMVSDQDPVWHFSASHLAVDPLHSMLACGPSYSRKVRVLSLRPPFNVIWEAHGDEGPITSWGLWDNQRVDFQAGKFLVVESFCSRPLGVSGEHVVEVYDMTTMEKVWDSGSLPNGSALYFISISPDGKKIAFFRDHYIEILPFGQQYTATSRMWRTDMCIRSIET